MKSTEFIIESTIENIVTTWEKEGAQVSLHRLKNGAIELSKIIIPRDVRHTGAGTKFMRELTAYADQSNTLIVLTPSTDFGASSIARLIKFYKSFGFVQNTGKNKDYEITQSMYRLPSDK
jgi:predicted GNAT family N-acyltransferase